MGEYRIWTMHQFHNVDVRQRLCEHCCGCHNGHDAHVWSLQAKAIFTKENRGCHNVRYGSNVSQIGLFSFRQSPYRFKWFTDWRLSESQEWSYYRKMTLPKTQPVSLQSYYFFYGLLVNHLGRWNGTPQLLVCNWMPSSNYLRLFASNTSAHRSLRSWDLRPNKWYRYSARWV